MYGLGLVLPPGLLNFKNWTSFYTGMVQTQNGHQQAPFSATLMALGHPGGHFNEQYRLQQYSRKGGTESPWSAFHADSSSVRRVMNLFQVQRGSCVGKGTRCPP